MTLSVWCDLNNDGSKYYEQYSTGTPENRVLKDKTNPVGWVEFENSIYTKKVDDGSDPIFGKLAKSHNAGDYDRRDMTLDEQKAFLEKRKNAVSRCCGEPVWGSLD